MNILFVEDNEDLLEVYLDEFNAELQDAALFSAKNGEEGIKICQEQSIDLIFTDQRMPLMTGTEMAQQLKTISPTTKIYLISGHIDGFSQEERERYNLTDYFMKPVDLDELISLAKKYRTE